MENVKDKFRYIFIPFLIIAICFIVTYSGLHWFLLVNNIELVREDFVNIWLPFILPWIPILIWLRPRIKLLRLKHDNASFGFQFMAAMAIAIPTIITQEYLGTSTGKLTEINAISKLQSKNPTKYYTIRNYFIDTAHISVYNTAEVSGKYSDKLNFYSYVALPILDKESDTAKGECSYYLGQKYSEQVSNNLSENDKEKAYRKFTSENKYKLTNSDFSKFIYLEKLGNTRDHEFFDKAILKGKLVIHRDEPLTFLSHNEPFTLRNGGKFGWIFKSFAIGIAAFFSILLIPKFHEASLNKFRKGEKIKTENYLDSLEILVPKDIHFVTSIFIDLNILVYLFMVIAGLGFVSFDAVDLLKWGANYRPYTVSGEWWRLLTNIFLHGGIMHIFANMTGLLFVGIFLEPLIGRKRFAIIYLITGIFASIISLWWHDAVVSVGASGAIFGLYGLFLALMLFKVFPKEFSKSFLLTTMIFIGFNLLMGLTGGIDNAAHIGGLVSGFVIGSFLYPTLKRETAESYLEA